MSDFEKLWRCPHCRMIFEKTPQLITAQNIGGRYSFLGELKCPNCKKILDGQRLIAGAYDT